MAQLSFIIAKVRNLSSFAMPFGFRKKSVSNKDSGPSSNCISSSSKTTTISGDGASIPKSAGVVECLREDFNNFDTNNSDCLEANEVQAALTQLGKPLHASVIATLMQLKGVYPGVSFESFIRFYANTAYRNPENFQQDVNPMVKLLSAFDADKDGKLTLLEMRQLGRDLCIPYEEFLKWTQTPWGEERTELPYNTILDCIKVFITRQIKSKKAQDLFKIADLDNSGTLSLAEIKRLFGASNYDIEDEVLQSIFRSADANGDGELDDDEFLNLVKYLIENPHAVT